MTRGRRYVTIADQGLSSVSNFVTVSFAASVASVGQFGQFSIAYAVLLLFLGGQRALVGETLLVKYSLPGAVTHFVRRAALGGTVGVSLLAVGILVIGGLSAGQEGRVIWFTMAAIAPVVLLQDCLRYIFICEGRPFVALLIDGVWAITSIPLMIFFRGTGVTLPEIVGFWGLGAALSFIVAECFVGTYPSVRSGWHWILRNKDFSLRYLFEFSTLNASSLIVIYFLVIPLGPAGVGALRAAQLLFSPLNTAFAAIKMAVIPELVRSRATPAFRARVVETFCVVGGAALLWGAAVVFLPRDWGHVLLGATWGNASELRVPYVAQYLLLVPYTVFLALFRARESNKQSTLMRGTLALATLVLPLTLGIFGGSKGAAWGFAIGAGIAVIVGGLLLVSMRRSSNRGRVDFESAEVE